MPLFDISAFTSAPAVERPSLGADRDFAAYGRRMKKEEEIIDLVAFLDAYPRATGEELNIEDVGESPDAICTRDDGTRVGVEVTAVRRSPDDARWQAIIDQRCEMDDAETLDEINRLIFQKAELRPKFRIEQNILMLAICESDFDLAVALAEGIPLEDLEATGFEEIWLVDFKGVRDHAHREVRLFGLFPEEFRVTTERSMFDQKPYG